MTGEAIVVNSYPKQQRRTLLSFGRLELLAENGTVQFGDIEGTKIIVLLWLGHLTSSKSCFWCCVSKNATKSIASFLGAIPVGYPAYAMRSSITGIPSEVIGSEPSYFTKRTLKEGMVEPGDVIWGARSASFVLI